MAGNRVISAVLTLKDKNFGSTAKKTAGTMNDLQRRTKHSSNAIKNFGTTAVTNFKRVAVGAAGMAAAYVGITAFKDLSVSMVQNAATAQAMNSQFEQVFSGIESKATDSLSKVANETGILSERLKGSFLGMAAFAKTTGMDTAGALALTERATLAAADGAAFYDKSIEEVSESLQSFLKGNFENDAALGISATETTRNAAANKLYGKSFVKLSEDQKQLTLLQMVEDGNKLSGALGQAARETDGLENVMGNLRSSWDTIKAKLGEPLLGPVVKGMKSLTSVISNVNTDSVINGFRNFGNIGKVAIDFIRPGLSWLKDVAFPAIKTAADMVGTAISLMGQWAASAFKNMKERAQENSPIIDGVRGIVQDLGDKAVWLKDVMVQAFESAKPAIGWLKDEGLPLIVDGAASVIEKATELYNYINDNWNSISPIVYGIASAITFYKVGMLIAAGATKLMTGVTIAMSVAQGALNAVMLISPFGWVAIAIGAVVAAGILLYKNWDTVKEKAQSLWDKAKLVGEGLKSAFTVAFSAVKDAARVAMNFVIDKINAVINLINKIPMVDIPSIPSVSNSGGAEPANQRRGGVQASYAVGTNRVPKDQVAQIHKDEMIVPARQSRNLRKQGVGINNIDRQNVRSIKPAQSKASESKGNGHVFNININGHNMSVDQIMNEMVTKIERANFNMA